jgi:hypothetical protein
METTAGMSGSRLRRWLPVLVAGAVICPVNAAEVATFEHNYDVGIGFSDNVKLGSIDPIDETIASAGLHIAVAKDTRRVQADILGNLEYLKYLDDTYDPELRGEFVGNANVAIVPERFDWAFQDNFGQIRRDPLAELSPSNLENVNVFSTGPSLYLGVSTSNQVELSARYSKVDYEFSPFDSERYSGAVSLQRRLSNSSLAALTATRANVTLDAGVVESKFEISQLFAQYSIDGRRGSLAVDAGVGRVDRNGEGENSLLLRVASERNVGSRSILRMNLGREISDSGQSLQFQQGLDGTGLSAPALFSTDGTYINNYANVEWDVVGRLTTVGVNATYYLESYPDRDDRDLTRLRAGAHFIRELGSRLSWRVNADVLRTELTEATAYFTEYRLGTGLTWRLGANLYSEFTYDYQQRVSQALLADYTENRVWLRLRYGKAITRTKSVISTLSD